MKNDAQLQQDVQEAIGWERSLGVAEIGVIAKNGIVTLTGNVDNYAKKLAAENAAKNVSGVKAVVESIEINYADSHQSSDIEIAREAVRILKWNKSVPEDKVHIKVEDGWITLEGELQWFYQKEEAKKALEHLQGVKGVLNRIMIKPNEHDVIERDAIVKALQRNWSIDDQLIEVNVLGNYVTLSGTVKSIYQKEEAGKIAWNAPGVWSVENDLLIA